MDVAQLRQYLLTKPETDESFPFGNEARVFKVKNKMFALIGQREGVTMLNLKCEPTESEMLRDIFTSIKPAYHMNKKHWISIYFDGSVPKGEVQRLIDNSFQLVVDKMTKKDQRAILIHLENKTVVR